MTIMTVLAIAVAVTLALVVGIGAGGAAVFDMIRRSGYVVERVPDSRPTRYRIGVRSDAAPVVPAVEWIAPARVTTTNTVRIGDDTVARLGHKPRGGGRS